jgi:hypothetical protein
MTQPLKKRSEGRKKWVKGLDNSGNIEGHCIRPISSFHRAITMPG